MGSNPVVFDMAEIARELLKKTDRWAGDMAQQLRVLTVLPEMPGLLTSIHSRQITTTYDSRFRESNTLSGLCWPIHSYAHTPRQIHMQISTKIKS